MALLTSGCLTSEHFSYASFIVRTGCLLAANFVGIFTRHVLCYSVSHALLFTFCHQFRQFLLLCPERADYTAGFTNYLGANHMMLSVYHFSTLVHRNLLRKAVLSHERRLENGTTVMLLLTFRNVCTLAEMLLKLKCHTVLCSTSTDNNQLPVASLQDCKHTEVYV